MSFLLVRSIPMSRETSEAYRSAGAIYPRRDRDIESINTMILSARVDGVPFRFILNYGNSNRDFNGYAATYPNTVYPNKFFWNQGRDIRSLVAPSRSRELLGEFMPGIPTSFPATVWLKPPGRGGRGKYIEEIMSVPKVPIMWDIQEHIEGQEYRIITVGNRVVQSSKRHGENGDRSYEWVGTAGTPTIAKDLARAASKKLDGSNVVGWDIIHDESEDTIYLLEGNSAPGVNGFTANRIVTEIVRQIEEEN